MSWGTCWRPAKPRRHHERHDDGGQYRRPTTTCTLSARLYPAVDFGHTMERFAARMDTLAPRMETLLSPQSMPAPSSFCPQGRAAMPAFDYRFSWRTGDDGARMIVWGAESDHGCKATARLRPGEGRIPGVDGKFYNGYRPQLDVVMKEGGHATSNWPPRRRGTAGSSC